MYLFNQLISECNISEFNTVYFSAAIKQAGWDNALLWYSC